MRLTQGCFSFLPDLTDAQIEKQVAYAITKGYAMNVEWTDDPHPRNSYWELWGLPLFDIKDPAAVMFELAECRKLNPAGYIKFCLLYTSPSPRDGLLSRMPSSA